MSINPVSGEALATGDINNEPTASALSLTKNGKPYLD